MIFYPLCVDQYFWVGIFGFCYLSHMNSKSQMQYLCTALRSLMHKYAI